MKRLLLSAFCLLLAALLAGCQLVGLVPAQTPGEGTATAAPSPASERTFKVAVVASNLEVPWALAFSQNLPGVGPGNYLLFTERPGRVRLIADGRLQSEPVATLPVTTVGEAGLLGLALDPDFAANGYLYVMYTHRADFGLRNRISRLTLHGTRAGDEKVLLDDIPGAAIHDGGGLAFGPDGKLYATTGDAAQGSLAQDLSSPAGKVLRLNPDGSMPTDNPFAGSPVFTYGHRNSEGLAWHPRSGQPFVVEHGPAAHDEVNRLSAGSNYGWPHAVGMARDARFVDPVHESGSQTWAPAGAAFYAGGQSPQWEDNLFFGALRGRHLHRLALGGHEATQVIAEEGLFGGEYGRIRAVAVGPEGALYFSTSNRDGRGQPAADDDRILRLVPG